jgi:hypothetical protein
MHMYFTLFRYAPGAWNEQADRSTPLFLKFLWPDTCLGHEQGADPSARASGRRSPSSTLRAIRSATAGAAVPERRATQR